MIDTVVWPTDLRTSVLRFASGFCTTVLAAFALGGLTSYAQTFLSDELRSFANSASGWTVLTVAVVWALRRGTWPSAVYGTAGFVTLVLGYQVVSALRGWHYNPTIWLLVGVVAGPVVGVAASWSRRDGVRAAAATALLAGVGLGDAWYGLTEVADSTSPVYWTLIAIVALVLLGGMLGRRLRSARAVVVAVGGTALTAVVFRATFEWVGLLFLG